LLERFSTVRIVQLGLLLSAAFAAVGALSTSRGMLYFACLMGGVGYGATSTAIALMIMDRVVPSRRGLAFGIKTAAVPTASAIAGLGAYAVATWGVAWQYVFWLAVIASVISAATLAPPRSGHEPRVERRERVPRSPLSRSLRLLGIAGLLSSGGMAPLSPFLVEGLIAKGESPAMAASVLAISGWLGIVSRVLVGVLADRVPRPLFHLKTTVALLMLASTSLAGLAFGRGELVLVSSSFMAFGLGWAWPGLVHYATMATHLDDVARAATHIQTGTFVGAVVGPLGFGLIVSQLSFAWAWASASLAVLTGAALVTWAVVILSPQEAEAEADAPRRRRRQGQLVEVVDRAASRPRRRPAATSIPNHRPSRLRPWRVPDAPRLWR
jgi:MFS family permease